jgi:hypothetical protein
MSEASMPRDLEIITLRSQDNCEEIEVTFRRDNILEFRSRDHYIRLASSQIEEVYGFIRKWLYHEDVDDD